jgi:hypothetical protein
MGPAQAAKDGKNNGAFSRVDFLKVVRMLIILVRILIN